MYFCDIDYKRLLADAYLDLLTYFHLPTNTVLSILSDIYITVRRWEMFFFGYKLDFLQLIHLNQFCKMLGAFIWQYSWIPRYDHNLQNKTL